MKRSKSTKFVVFEGPEGAGKSTIMAAVAERLEALDQRVALTHEPNKHAPVTALIRRALDVEDDLHMSRAELLDLYNCAREDHHRRILQPLDDGDRKIVLCDRYYPSSLVYQALPDPDLTLRMLGRARKFWTPDAYVYLYADVATLHLRVTERVGKAEIFDSKAALASQLMKYDQAMNMLACALPPLLDSPMSQVQPRMPQLLSYNTAFEPADEIATDVVNYLRRELLR